MQVEDGTESHFKARFNSEGALMLSFRYSAGFQNDHIEKKQFITKKGIVAMKKKPRLRGRACNGMIAERIVGLLNWRG